MEIDPKLVKSSFISNKIKKILNEKNITITQISENIWASRPSISNILNWKVIWSDNIFKKLLKAIWLTDKQIKEIFKEADLETLKYKYWEDVLSSKGFSYEELFEMMQEKENLSDEQVKAIQDFIEFQKRQGK